MKSKLNILYITHVSTMLGANRSLLNLLSGLEGKIKFTIILPQKGAFSDELDSRGIPYHVVKFKHVCVQRHSFLKTLFLYLPRLWRITIVNAIAVIKLSNVIKLNNFDIIHSNSGIISLGQSLSKKFDIPHVWHLREFQDLDYNLEYISGKKEYLKLLNKADAVIAISKSVKSHFNIDKQIVVIYNGLFTKDQVHDQINETNGTYFLFCGALVFDKGIEDAINAFAGIVNKHPLVKLKIAGDFVKPDYKNKVLDLVNSLGLSNSVIFLGFQNNLTRLMQNAIALFMCSHNEAFGRVTFEAMYNKCLVIGFKNAGTGELIVHNVNGLLYENMEGFERQIHFSINNKSACIQLKNEAYKFVMANFTEKVYADHVLNVYETLI